ncbi:MAG: type II toxin-antitoxin system HicB family antitoxin [Clostridia bacterium]|nr:type II toxin-antitoxin system HicB family antitoxin [Clostridia bacterium]
MKSTYTAVFTPDPCGGFEVRIPDIPHCFTRGATAQEARELIEDAASQMLIFMEDNGFEIPSPSFSVVLTAPEGGFTALISIDTDKTRMMEDSQTTLPFALT